MSDLPSEPSEDQLEATPNQQSTSEAVDIIAPPPLIQVVGAQIHTYDADKVGNFIDAVFADMPTLAHRLVYTSKTNLPFKPLTSVAALDKVLRRTTAPRALYFCTASCYAPPDGGLSHKKALFAALHVVVLDDIGTKIPVDNLPEALKTPSYIIETSKDNFQYGYFLEEPITDYESAATLIKTLGLAGLTDKGGAMPCKLVRLPDGINGKDDPVKRDFRVNLVEAQGALFTPEEILAAAAYSIAGTEVTWDAIKNKTVDPMSSKYNNKFLSKQPIAQSTSGEIDEVLEWLYENDMVLEDSGDGWVQIQCPQAHLHTDVSQTSAGYLPMGRGDDLSRGFNCFHDSCSSQKTAWFLGWVISQSDFTQLAIKQAAYMPHGEYAYNRTTDRIHLVDHPEDAAPFPSFKRGFKGMAWAVINANGDQKSVSPVELWMNSPYSIVIQGVRTDIAEDVVYEYHTKKWLNTYKPIPWGTGAYDQGEVDRIVNYVKYLIPDPDEFDYVMQWLAAKIQNPTFRGAGLVMVTPTQGIGRTTFCNMVRTMIGMEHTTNVPFDTLTGGSEFNDWADKLLVIIDEAKESSDIRRNQEGYNKLKQQIDTTSSMTRLNLKHQGVVNVQNNSSFIVCTNYGNGVAMDKNDRRLMVITNPDVPNSPQFFIDLNTHLARKDADGIPTWARHFVRYLLTMTPDMALLSRAINTIGKQQLVQAAMSMPERGVEALERYCIDKGIRYITASMAKRMIDQAIAHHSDGTTVQPKSIEIAMGTISMAFAHSKKWNKKTEKIRVIQQSMLGGAATHYSMESLSKKWRTMLSLGAEVIDELDAIDQADMTQAIIDGME